MQKVSYSACQYAVGHDMNGQPRSRSMYVITTSPYNLRANNACDWVSGEGIGEGCMSNSGGPVCVEVGDCVKR